MKSEHSERLKKEFDHQVETLLQKGYPKLAGVSAAAFTKALQPLRAKVTKSAVAEIKLDEGKLPFVIVIQSEWVSTEKALQRVERKGKRGFLSMFPVKPESFEPIEGVKIPRSRAYLLLDVDRGKKTLNVAPDAALKMIKKTKRSPLTIDEGIAVLTHYPDFLKKNNCFSMLASRCGDRRVPALWLSAGRPKLGWCWAGNPHTWLGSASCGKRVGLLKK